MSQIVPDQELPSISLSDDEFYSSIDDAPQPIPSDDKCLSHLLEQRNHQCLQQSMKFHFGITVTNTPETASLLPDIIPTHFSPEHLKESCQISSQEEPDQLVAGISKSKSFLFTGPMKPFPLNNHRGFYFRNSLSDDLFHKPKVNIPIEWRSTKLPSDKLEALKRAFLCFSQRCDDEVCGKGKRLLDEMKKRIQQFKVVDSDDRQILEYILEHTNDCTEYFCISPGCNLMEKSANTLAELIDCINKDDKKLEYSTSAKFFRFSSDCYMKCPKDVIETTIHSISTQNSIIIFQSNSKWAKVTVLGNLMQDILPLLIEIGNLSNHTNILPIDWLIDDQQTIFYSSEYYAEPLKCKFDIINMNRKQIILQLIEAALYLNANGVAFLAWTSDNIYWKNGIVRLTNFHMGSALYHDFDPGVIKSLLFPTIVPPELHSQDTNLEKADVWGVCCLFYELLTREVVHSHLLHMERNIVWRKLDENGWRPKCTFSDPDLQSIFDEGWQEHPQYRSTLIKLKSHILDYKNDL